MAPDYSAEANNDNYFTNFGGLSQTDSDLGFVDNADYGAVETKSQDGIIHRVYMHKDSDAGFQKALLKAVGGNAP